MTVTYKVEVDKNETVRWYNQQGKLHREGDKPAVEYADGAKQWWFKGQLHREGDKPAGEYADGSKEWLVNGQFHREGGLPAVEFEDGYKAWYVNGQLVTEEQAKAMFNKPTCNGKVVEIDGKKFKLVSID